MNAVLKTAPHSVEAEQAVIGSCLLKNEIYHQIPLTASDFFRADHRVIWNAIAELASEENAFDVVTLSDWLAARNELEDAGGLAYLATVARDTPTTENAIAYAEIVKERARKRAALAVLSDAMNALHGAEDTTEVAGVLSAKLENLTTSGGDLSFRAVLGRGFRAMQEAITRREQGDGLRFGLPALDHALGTLWGPRLVILAGRPSTGKTALAHQMAMVGAKRGLVIGKIELEMGAEEIAHRSLAFAYGVNVTHIAQGEPDTRRAIITKAAEHNIRDYPIYVDEHAFTVPEICARIAEWHRKYAIRLAIVDHLQLVSVPGDNRAQGLGRVTRSLKLLAKRINTPIMLLSQFNRANAKESARPRLDGLRDSGEIEQDADVVIALHGDLDADRNGDRSVEIGLLKNRGGRVGWLDHHHFMFRGRIQRFDELESTDGPIERPGYSSGTDRATGET